MSKISILQGFALISKAHLKGFVVSLQGYLRAFSLKAIAFYQRFLSVLKPRCCRFYPSCSEFARQSFEKNGFFRALWASFFRILRCNPYFKGGFDYPKMPKSSLKINKWRAVLPLGRLKFLYVPCDESCFFVVKIVF